MNLQPIQPDGGPLFWLPKACSQCGCDVLSSTGYADLDGEPFKAYRCAECLPLLPAPTAYRGYSVRYDRSAPVTDRFRASRFGVGLCANHWPLLKRMIDQRIEEAQRRRQDPIWLRAYQN
jgi:hypothetical protein